MGYAHEKDSRLYQWKYQKTLDPMKLSLEELVNKRGLKWSKHHAALDVKEGMF